MKREVLMLYLSIDIGTSAVKVALLDEGVVERAGAVAHYTVRYGRNGEAEIDLDAILEGVSQACSRLDESLLQMVDAVVYDTFSPSPIFVKKDASLAYPSVITHLDRRAKAEVAAIGDAIGIDAFMRIAGFLPFVGGSAVTTILWMGRNLPQVTAKTEWFTHLSGYFHYVLTGDRWTDSVNASMTGLFETVTRGGWSAEILGGLGIPASWLAPVVDPGRAVGSLRAEAAAVLGVASGTPVILGTNDIAAAQIGAGNRTSGAVINGAGSSDMISILTDRPIVSPHHYLRYSAIPGLWQVYATTAGGFALEWFRTQFAREVTKEEFYSQLVPLAIKAYEDGSGVRFTPFLAGDRQSLEPRTATWTGLRLGVQRTEMLGALIYAGVEVLADALRRSRSLIGISPEVMITGGLAIPPLIELKGRLFGDVMMSPVANCPIKGNVRLAQVGLQAG